MAAVLEYLQTIDPEAAARRQGHRCFDHRGASLDERQA